jgi:hypothetical protein
MTNGQRTNESAGYLSGISQDDAGFIYWRGKMVVNFPVPTTQSEHEKHRKACETLHRVCTDLEAKGIEVNFVTIRNAVAMASSKASQAFAA